SIRARTWPSVTRSLKSTSTSSTWPEIWLPTVTVEDALRVPVEEMATRMWPRSTGAVRQAPSVSRLPAPPQYQAAPPRRARTSTPPANGSQRGREFGREVRLMGAWMGGLPRLTHDPGIG